MANTVFKLRRSSVAGKVPNTSTVAIGELAINLTDKILYSSDGSNVFEIGANNTNVNVSNTLTVKSISANGSVGGSGQVLSSNGSSVYWQVAADAGLPVRQQFTANGTATTFAVPGGYVANNLSVFLNGVLLRNGVNVDVSSGIDFVITPAPANGSLIDIVGTSAITVSGLNTTVSQQFTANGTANSFTITNGYIPNQVEVYLNGVKQIPGVDVVVSSGNTVGFIDTPANGFIVDVYGYQTAVVATSNVLTVGANLVMNTSLITLGNSTVNTQITAGNIALNGSRLFVGNSTVNTVIDNTISSFGTNTVTIGTTFYSVANGNIGIGTSSPAYTLQISNGVIAASGNTGFVKDYINNTGNLNTTPARNSIFVNGTYTSNSTSASYFGILSNPSIVTNGSNGFIYSISSIPRIESSGVSDYIFSAGIIAQAFRNSNNDISANSLNGLVGAQFLTGHNNSSNASQSYTTTTVSGIATTVQNQNGIITTSRSGFFGLNLAAVANRTASVNTHYGILTSAAVGAASGTGTGTLTNYYDAYFTGVTVNATGTVTNKYGVYQVATDHINYFGGNVGIGTTTPAHKFDVIGTNNSTVARFYNSAGQSAIRIETGANDKAVVEHYTNGNGNWRIGPGITTAGAYEFNSVTAGATRMMISSAGDALIATTTGHNSRLSIKSNSSDQHLVFEQENVTTDGWGLRCYGAGGGKLEFSRMTSTTAFQSMMTLDASGNLGIGTTSPSTKLDVVGTTRITQNTSGTNGLLVNMPTGAETTASGIRVFGYSPSIELMDKDNVQNWYMGIDDNDGNKLVFARGYGPGQGIAPALAIDSSDRVTMPSQPAFSALGPYPGNIYLISVSAGSGYVILWQGTYINVGSHYSTSTGRFTAPVAGNYMFQLSITNSGTGAGPIGFIRKNGSSVAQCAAYSVAYSTASVTVILPLAVNDYVDAYFAAFNVAAGIDLSYSNFCGHLIG